MKKLIVILCTILVLKSSSAQELGIINNRESAHVKVKSINIGDCRWTSGSWADKFKLCEEVMVPHMGTLFKGDIGRTYNNFKIAAHLEEGKHQGANWHDGDFYKWMESAAYVHAIDRDPQILAELDEIIQVIGKAQADDGYCHPACVRPVSVPSSRKWRNASLPNRGHAGTVTCSRTTSWDILCERIDIASCSEKTTDSRKRSPFLSSYTITRMIPRKRST